MMENIKDLQAKEREIREKVLTEQAKREKELIPVYRKEFVGKCFKYRNSYGSDSKPWWLYIKIIDVDSVNFYNGEEPCFRTIQIQMPRSGHIEIDTRERGYVRAGEYVPIKNTEFNRNARKILEAAHDLVEVSHGKD